MGGKSVTLEEGALSSQNQTKPSLKYDSMSVRTKNLIKNMFSKQQKTNQSPLKKISNQFPPMTNNYVLMLC